MSCRHHGSELPDMTEALGFLNAGEDFVLTSHINTDADGLGGCLALRGLLSRLGKLATVVLSDEPNPRFSFLSGLGEIRQATDRTPLAKTGYAVVLDCPDLQRVGGVQDCISAGAQILNIDHHRDNSHFGRTNLVSHTVSSSCELVYYLAIAARTDIDVDMAEQIYTGILWDTGGFRYSATTPRTFQAAAHLVQIGVRVDVIADRLFHSKSLAAVKSIGKGIDSLELALDGRAAILTLECQDTKDADCETIVDFGLQVEEVVVSMLFKEETRGEFRVSLRSRNDIDVRTIAAGFGGGGHTRAAGCHVEGTFTAIKAAFLKEVAKSLAESSAQQ